MDEQKLRSILNSMPAAPGVYIMKNQQAEIIYIGKSVSIDKRVKSYFSSKSKDSKTQALVASIEAIDYLITDNETEALILENNLIKKHKPKYNILLKDSKTHPYLRITLNEKYPRLEKVRKVSYKDNNKYFGPFPKAGDLNRIIEMLSKKMLLCDSKKSIAKISDNAKCLKYDLGLCSGACIGKISPQKYAEKIFKTIDLLSGKANFDLKSLETQLTSFASEFRYEEASELRDMITAFKRFFSTQKVEFLQKVDADIWGLSSTADRIVISIFFIRSGKMLGNRIIDIETEPDSTLNESLGSIINQFYNDNLIPPNVFVAELPEPLDSLVAILSEKSKKKVRIKMPIKGKFKKLLTLANENALEIQKSHLLSTSNKVHKAVIDLQERLKLSVLPNRIECVDISHTQGVDPVASLVVFINGVPEKSEYRLFHIKEAQGGNDPASIAEVIKRRFLRLLKESATLPDLLIIDGGIAQVRAADKELKKLGLSFNNLFGLAEKNETLIDIAANSYQLPFSAPGMRMLIKLRNEAHRFANRFHAKTHTKKLVRSSLLTLPGVGPTIFKKLISFYGSITKIGQAKPEELQKIASISLNMANLIIHSIREK